jgi:hypothetical protein
LLAFSFPGGLQTVEIAIPRVLNFLIGDSGSKDRKEAPGCHRGTSPARRLRSGFGSRNACLNVGWYNDVGVNLIADGKACESGLFFGEVKIDGASFSWLDNLNKQLVPAQQCGLLCVAK